MNQSDSIFCTIILFSFPIMLLLMTARNKGWLLGQVRKGMHKAKPEKREGILLRWNFFGMLTRDQYDTLQREFSLIAPDPEPGPENQEPIKKLSEYQIKEIQSLAALYTLMPASQRMMHFEDLLTYKALHQ